jgi:alpha-beta hydrolase superfamily lysophospholipase
MTEPHTWTLTGFDGSRRHAVTWSAGSARYVALVSHGYGEHTGRYQHVADALVAAGAAVYALDHVGHGQSEGDRAVVPDYDGLVDDLHRLDQRAREENPALPVVLVGHSMGGLVALRYAQEYGDTLAALVLSGPQVAGKEMLEQLLALPQFPELPVDASVLSRDPRVGEAYLADPLVWHGGLQRPTVEAMVRALTALADGKRVDSLPVLWLHGTDDQLSPLAAARPVVEAVVTGGLQQRAYPGARHEIFNETNRDEILADVVGFIDRTL